MFAGDFKRHIQTNGYDTEICLATPIDLNKNITLKYSENIRLAWFHYTY